MFCDRAKEFLSRKGVPFEVRDISADETAMAELTVLGFMTTPVIVIDGEVIVGFDSAKIEAALQGRTAG